MCTEQNGDAPRVRNRTSEGSAGGSEKKGGVKRRSGRERVKERGAKRRWRIKGLR